MKGFLLGLGIGLAIGVLYAPQEGRKSRTDFAERADDLLSRVDEILDKTKKAAREGFESAVAADSRP
ncbi:MAG: YtxH-like protein [Acidobacteriaceae bacterium]|jgi:gas vesicle protein